MRVRRARWSSGCRPLIVPELVQDGFIEVARETVVVADGPHTSDAMRRDPRKPRGTRRAGASRQAVFQSRLRAQLYCSRALPGGGLFALGLRRSSPPLSFREFKDVADATLIVRTTSRTRGHSRSGSAIDTIATVAIDSLIKVRRTGSCLFAAGEMAPRSITGAPHPRSAIRRCLLRLFSAGSRQSVDGRIAFRSAHRGGGRRP